MFKEKAARIKLVFVDVDGVMTDGRITMNDEGREVKSFDVKDGLGIKMLVSQGVEVVFVSGRKAKVLEFRAKELGIGELYQGVTHKSTLCRRVINEHGLDRAEVACIGDDLPDLAMFREAGLRIAVADAAREVREQADFITTSRGGRGALREVCERILRSQGKWSQAVSGDAGK